MSDPQLRQTAAFIAAKPLSVVLIPRTRQSNGSGGYTMEDGNPRDPQTVTLIPQTGNPRPTTTEDGPVQRIDYVMVAMPEAIVAKDDYWVDGSSRFTVAYLFPSNGYELRAGVVLDAVT